MQQPEAGTITGALTLRIAARVSRDDEWREQPIGPLVVRACAVKGVVTDVRLRTCVTAFSRLIETRTLSYPMPGLQRLEIVSSVPVATEFP